MKRIKVPRRLEEIERTHPHFSVKREGGRVGARGIRIQRGALEYSLFAPPHTEPLSFGIRICTFNEGFSDFIKTPVIVLLTDEFWV